MNVSSTSIQSQMFQNSSSTSNRSSSLSKEQTATIEDVLSQYDANSLSESDAMEIKDAFAEAGIEPSQAMAKAMESAGFDAKEIGDLASESGASSVESKGGGRPMGPPPPSDEEEVDSLTELLESLLSSDEDDDESTTSTTATTDDTSASSSSFDMVLDYTSKIMSLKDDAKTEVTNLLEKYNSDENQLSKEDTEKFIVNSLSQILKESDNYNTISFYA